MDLLDTTLLDALKRKPKKLAFQTVYSHLNLLEWLKESLPKWNIMVPQNQSPALSEWPSTAESRLEIINWLKEKKYPDAEDLINGACEPLALFLSSRIKNSLLEGTFVDSLTVMSSCKSEIETLDPEKAAALVFGKCLNNELNAPSFWGLEFQGSYADYLFGKDTARKNIIAAAASYDIYVMPLYILNYIFDNNELGEKQLRETIEETAQYSLHAVGLVFDKVNKRVIVADPNGYLIPGSNIEFLKIPLQKRKAKPSTSVSRYDLDSRKRKADAV
jgi:hypothetical protein